MSQCVMIYFFFCSVVLSVAVYDKQGHIIDGSKVAALINANKQEFEVGISSAVVGECINHTMISQ